MKYNRQALYRSFKDIGISVGFAAAILGVPVLVYLILLPFADQAWAPFAMVAITISIFLVSIFAISYQRNIKLIKQEQQKLVNRLEQ